MDSSTLHWLAGLLEGEGSFGAITAQGWSQIRPIISIQMNDEDVIGRVAQLFDLKYAVVPPPKPHWGIAYKLHIRGERAYDLMKLLYPLMGQRRQSQINKVFSQYTPAPNVSVKYYQNPILNDDKVRQIKRRIAAGEFARSIAADFGVTIYMIREISQGKSWKHVTLDETTENVQPQRIIGYDLNSLDWLAGLLEAEGSFMEGPPSAPNQHVISIQMTDEDVIARTAHILECSYNHIHRKNEKHKDYFIAYIRGRRAIEMMKILRPLMGVRRQGQIDKCLASFIHRKPRITEETAREIKIRLANGERMHSIAETLNVIYTIVKKINQGRNWKHVTI